MAFLKLNDNSLSVCKYIVQQYSEILAIELVAHKVGKNWRQVYSGKEEKLAHLSSAFIQTLPLRRVRYERDKFMSVVCEDLPKVGKHCVWSISSKVWCKDQKYRHIGMMNFHSETGSLDDIIYSIQQICGHKPGILLNSGRYFHYYGNFLLGEDEWRRFMVSFLMPCVLVSPRYIGHRLYAGYCTLRLTVDQSYKPVVPYVVHILDHTHDLTSQHEKKSNLSCVIDTQKPGNVE